MSLDQRLAEIPKTSSFNKMELLREELERTNVQTRDSVVAKMAALSGKLNLRFDVLFLLAWPTSVTCHGTQDSVLVMP